MSFIDSFAKLVGTVGTALETYSTPAIAIAKDVIGLIDEAVPVVNSTADAQQLLTMKEDLEAKVMAHADAVEKELRGS